MKKQFKLGIIGCGFIATTILRGVVLSDFLREKKIIVSDINEDKLNSVDYLGVNTCQDNRFVAENSEYLIIAVKSKNFDEVAKSIEGIRPEKVISVMTGISKNYIKNALGVGLIKVARCVPNMPCSIGSGAIGIDMADFNKSNTDTDFISNIFNRLGTVVSMEESKLDAVTALNCNVSHALMFIDSLLDAGVKLGLSKNEAKIFAAQSVFGITEMVLMEEKSIDELVAQNCEGGTFALETVKALDESSFRKEIFQAVEASYHRLSEQK